MTARKHRWPLRPALTAQILDGLAQALEDLVINYSPEREASLLGVAMATKVFSGELAGFFMELEPADERLLEDMEQKWLRRL